jgi:ribosomal protein S27AE
MYQFVCPQCNGRSFSAAKLSSLKNPVCPYCGSLLTGEKEHLPDELARRKTPGQNPTISSKQDWSIPSKKK